MAPLDFHSYPLWLLIAIFSSAAIAVWIAGTRLSRYAGIISDRTGIGQAVVGLILLGGITSLPEVATSMTASWTGNAALAVNNILGGVAMQVVVLAIGDFFLGRSALTGTLPRPHVTIQAALSIVLLALVAAGIAVGDTMLFGFGAWPSAVLIGFLVTLYVAQSAEQRVVWALGEAEQTARQKQVKSDGRKPQEEEVEEAPTSRVVSKTVAAAATILVAGYLIARTGESIAEATGLGQSFFGVVFVAICTSLPELSSVISAVRLGREMLAIGDVLGGNLFDLALIFPIDAIYSGGPVLNEIGTFSLFAASLGIVLTTLYIIGMVERRDRAVFRLGYDSLAVLLRGRACPSLRPAIVSWRAARDSGFPARSSSPGKRRGSGGRAPSKAEPSFLRDGGVAIDRLRAGSFGRLDRTQICWRVRARSRPRRRRIASASGRWHRRAV